MTRDELQKLEKIELHCHLDGSLGRRFVESRLGRSVEEEELSVTASCRSLQEYLEKFALPGGLLQTEEGLEGAAYNVLEGMKEDGVCYAEVRFAPLLSTREGLSAEMVIVAVIRGMERGKRDLGVDYNLITCAMRHHSLSANEDMFRAAGQFLGKGVCGVDLAGAEASYPMSVFVDLFRRADATGMPITIHAGECGSRQNIRDAIASGARRIGHGIAMRGDPDLQKAVREAGIGVEMCPTSNFQTRALAEGEFYPIREFLDAGILVSVNTDNRTVSRCSLTDELVFLQERCGIRDEEIIRLMENAARTSFAEEPVSQKLEDRMSALRMSLTE